MAEKQKTIKNQVSLSGVGLHTGKSVNITFKPASENHGLIFKRIDLENQPEIAADVDNVVETTRGTTIAIGEARVSTVEHALAAICGLAIDNLLIELDGPEVPILDGSAKPFIDELEKAGIQLQEADRKVYELLEPVVYADRDRGVELMAVPDDHFNVKVMIDFNSKVIGYQHATLDNLSQFKDEFASSRTFVFLHELKALIDSNLIKGGDMNNAIIYVDKQPTENELIALREIFNKTDIQVTNEGVLNNVDLTYQNEAARHKLLDVIGDLVLIGQPIKAKIFATRPGHTSNIEFARKIKKLIKSEKLKKSEAPFYDINVPPLYDINKITQILPHRSPFLLVDKVIEMSENHVVGVKNVTMNEEFFRGHFPGNPIMPGVLQIEAMAQCGGILALSTVPDPENYLTYFMKIDQVKFKHKVIPGDTLVFKLELISPIRRGICHMRGQAFVGNKLVTEAEMMAQIVKEKTN